MSRPVTACIIALSILLCCVTPLLAQEAPLISLENEFVRAVVNRGPQEAGRFSIKTTGGDPARPASKGQHLIFGGNAPWTSYTTVMVDGTAYLFGGATKRRAGVNARTGTVTTTPALVNGKAVCTTDFGTVAVTQELALVRGMSSRMLDTIAITYRVTNTGTEARRVGLRVMLDTMCGTNDGAPVRAGSQALLTATALQGEHTPDYWQAFDNLASPTVISQGTLKGGAATPPDRILFADWGTFADDPWDPALTPGQSFVRKGEEEADTATAVLWEMESLDPGKTRTYTTYYGLGYVDVKSGVLTVGLTAPADATFEHERTQSLSVTGYLQNTGAFDARDVQWTFTVPAGLQAAGGSKIVQTIPLLKPGETVQANWVLKPDGKAGGALPLRLGVTSANIEANAVERKVQVTVPTQKLVVTPEMQRVPLQTNRRPTIIPIQVNLLPAEKFHGMRLTVTFDPKVLEPIGVSRGRAFVEDGRLLAGWAFDDAQAADGRITITGQRTGATPLTQAEVNLLTLKFITVEPGESPLTLTEAVLIAENGTEEKVDLTNGRVIVEAQ